MKVNENNAIKNFRELIKENHLLKKCHLERTAVFGSFARGEKANDVDILVENVDDYKKLIEFKIELEKLLHKKVDVVIEKFANPIVLHRAKKDMIYVTGY